MSDNYNIRLINECEIEQLSRIVKSSFANDVFFRNIQNNNLWDTFIPFWKFSIKTKSAFGCFDGDKLVGTLISANYKKLEKYPTLFDLAFIKEGNSIPFGKEISNMINLLSDNIQYIVDICVSNDYRRNGIAGKLIDEMMNRYEGYSFAVDISNIKSIPLYLNRGFTSIKLEENYALAWRL